MLFLIVLCNVLCINSILFSMEQISQKNIISLKEDIFDFEPKNESNDTTIKDPDTFTIAKKKDTPCKLVEAFLSIHQINIGSQYTPESLLNYFTKANPVKLAEEIHADVQKRIDDYTKSVYNAATVKHMLKNKLYAKKLLQIKPITQDLVKALQVCVSIPLYQYYLQAVCSNRSISLERLWCIYWLYFIPNMKYYDDGELDTIDNTINKYSIPEFVKEIQEAKTGFLNAFSDPRYRYQDLIDNCVFFELTQYIKEKQKNNEPFDHCQNMLSALTRLRNFAQPTIPNKDDLLKLNNYWKAFWNQVHKAYIEGDQLTTSQVVNYEAAYKFANKVDEIIFQIRSIASNNTHNNDAPKTNSFSCWIFGNNYKDKQE